MWVALVGCIGGYGYVCHGICRKESTLYSTDICTANFIVVLFTRLKKWKQPKCISTNKWVMTIWYMDTIKCYLGVKKYETMKFLGKWVELEKSILIEVTQAWKDDYYYCCWLSLECKLLLLKTSCISDARLRDPGADTDPICFFTED